MPDNRDDLTDVEQRLERTMTELGPLIERRKQAEAEGVDSAFAQELRRRLLGELPQRRPAITTRRGPRRFTSRLWATGVSAAVIAAVIVGLIFVMRPHASPAPALATVPQPTTLDLTRGYPVHGIMAGGGGGASPLFNPAQVGSSSPYPTKLSLSMVKIPSGPNVLPAYQLAGPPLTESSFRHLANQLGIRGREHVVQGQWLVAADGGGYHVNRKTGLTQMTPLHSLAMALDTGEIIYSDGRPSVGRGQRQTLTQGNAARLARSWLKDAVLSAGHLVAQSVVPVSPGLRSGSPLAVSYAWRGVHDSVAPAARLWVAPNGQVLDADVWPRIVRTVHVAAVSIATAWRRVTQGNAPIAVQKSGFLSPTGTGVARSVRVVQVRVAARHGKIYLVPAYRFSGTVHLRGAGTHTWYALVSAAR